MALEGRLTLLRGRLRKLLPVHADDSIGLMCNAPSASLYLDQRGDVRACCQNAGFPLGNVTEAPLSQIWRGERARRLRHAVADGDLSLGCNFCRWQVEDGSDDAVFARTFDHLSPESLEPEWPQQLELSMSNACNLQCVMCNGEWSSAIRAHREHLPPLPTVYGDAFFEDLAAFLPHLRVVKFLGGEPFLGGESLRVMEMLAELGTDIPVHITTNGTQWSPRIERILDRLNVHVVVSLDGVHQSTYESIRVGSSLDAVVANVDRFIAYSRERRTSFSLSHCLMVQNWHEFADFLDFAEVRGSGVWVNTVTEPYAMSLYHLTPGGLREVVEGLEASDAQVRPRLTGRRATVWSEQLVRLRRHLDSLEAHRPPDYIAKRRRLGFAWLAPPERAVEATERFDARTQQGGVAVLHLDQAGTVTTVERHAATSPELERLLAAHVDEGSPVPKLFDDPDEVDDGSVVPEDLHAYSLSVPDASGAPVELELVRLAVRDDDGVVVGARLMLGTRPLIEHVSARDAASAMAGSPEDLAGFLLDAEGRLSGFSDGATRLFGVEVGELLGQPAMALSSALSGPLGEQVGDIEDRGVVDGVQHHVTRFRGAAGLAELHSFAEPADGGSAVWIARRSVASDVAVDAPGRAG